MLVDLFGPLSLMNAAAASADAEALGFDGIWSTENRNDVFLSLVEASRATTRVCVGSGVAIAFARTPMTVAYAAHDLQVFSGGRLLLGLGSQVRAHITRRFSMPWSAPAPRMREFVNALQSIWSSWNDETTLRVTGEHYNHTLMNANFAPEPSPYGPPPVYLAGVGPAMTRVAGEVADGFIAHPFTTESYLRNVTMSNLGEGAALSVRSLPAVVLTPLVATGANEIDLAAALAAARRRIGFYGSTPAYRPVLEHHGMGDLQPRLDELVRAGRWDDLDALVPEELVREMVAAGEPAHVAALLRRRFGGIASRVGLNMQTEASPDVVAMLVTALRA